MLKIYFAFFFIPFSPYFTDLAKHIGESPGFGFNRNVQSGNSIKSFIH